VREVLLGAMMMMKFIPPGASGPEGSITNVLRTVLSETPKLL
jgi:hypothetical protein